MRERERRREREGRIAVINSFSLSVRKLLTIVVSPPPYEAVCVLYTTRESQ